MATKNESGDSRLVVAEGGLAEELRDIVANYASNGPGEPPTPTELALSAVSRSTLADFTRRYPVFQARKARETVRLQRFLAQAAERTLTLEDLFDAIAAAKTAGPYGAKITPRDERNILRCVWRLFIQLGNLMQFGTEYINGIIDLILAVTDGQCNVPEDVIDISFEKRFKDPLEPARGYGTRTRDGEIADTASLGWNVPTPHLIDGRWNLFERGIIVTLHLYEDNRDSPVVTIDLGADNMPVWLDGEVEGFGMQELRRDRPDIFRGYLRAIRDAEVYVTTRSYDEEIPRPNNDAIAEWATKAVKNSCLFSGGTGDRRLHQGFVDTGTAGVTMDSHIDRTFVDRQVSARPPGG